MKIIFVDILVMSYRLETIRKELTSSLKQMLMFGDHEFFIQSSRTILIEKTYQISKKVRNKKTQYIKDFIKLNDDVLDIEQFLKYFDQYEINFFNERTGPYLVSLLAKKRIFLIFYLL